MFTFLGAFCGALFVAFVARETNRPPMIGVAIMAALLAGIGVGLVTASPGVMQMPALFVAIPAFSGTVLLGVPFVLMARPQSG